MPELRYRSSSYKKRFKRAPGGRKILHYKKKKPSKHVCAGCGRTLHGVPRGRPYEIRRLSKSRRRPNRPYGGYYCSECMRRVFKEEARS